MRRVPRLFGGVGRELGNAARVEAAREGVHLADRQRGNIRIGD
jgi:hypothetical protein